jgi:hypothetical protein
VFAFASTPADKKADTLWQPIISLTAPAPLCHSVGFNDITGDAANHLATVVLKHATMTDFCGIPLTSLRENSITELHLEKKGVGVPGAIVLSKLLPSAARPLTPLGPAPLARRPRRVPLAGARRPPRLPLGGRATIVWAPPALKSLKCACRPKVFAFLSAPLDTPTLSPFPFRPSPAVSHGTALVPKEEPLSLRASRATPRCNH